jgi:uncharacterized protein DUF3618
MTANSAESSDSELQQLEGEIEQTRSEMSATIGAIENRLTPERVGTELKQVEERVRAVVHDELVEAKQLVKDELLEAKNLLREEVDHVEEKLKRGLGEARDAVKEDVKEAITGAKRAVRAATLGKVEDLATNIGDKMNETRDTLVDTVRNNPIPAGLVGVGLVWLLMNRSKSKQNGGREMNRDGGRFMDTVGSALGDAGNGVSRVAHRVGDAASSSFRHASDAASHAAAGVTDSASALVHDATRTASHLYDQASEAASSVADSTKRNVRNVEQALQDQLHENPLALGAAALAVGAVVGFALPRSQKEDALMGDARDRLLHQAGDLAHDAAGSAARLADQALEKVKTSGSEASSNA